MATIVSTELEIRLGTTASGALVGQKITESGSPSSINADISTLGVALSPGTQYCARARCTNSDEYTSDWTAPYAFKSLILAELGTITPDCDGSLSMDDGVLTYDTNDANIHPDYAGVYVSTSASGANATKITATDIQTFTGQGFDFGSGLVEHTLYYVIPFVIDQDNREYKADWSEAESVMTKYARPTVSISNVAHTYNSISGNVTIATSDTLGSAYLTIVPTGGGTAHTVNLTASTGLQSWSVQDGDTDSQGNTITISPSTEYRITIYAVNSETGGCTGSAQATVTTDQQALSTIAITSVTSITPTSAVVNLSYGDGNGGQQQGGGENQ